MRKLKSIWWALRVLAAVAVVAGAVGLTWMAAPSDYVWGLGR